MSPRVGEGGGGRAAEYEFDVSPGVYKCEFWCETGVGGRGMGGGGRIVSLGASPGVSERPACEFGVSPGV